MGTEVDRWNSLSEALVESGSFNAFKRHLDSQLNRQGIERCRANVGKWDQRNNRSI